MPQAVGPGDLAIVALQHPGRGEPVQVPPRAVSKAAVNVPGRTNCASWHLPTDGSRLLPPRCDGRAARADTGSQGCAAHDVQERSLYPTGADGSSSSVMERDIVPWRPPGCSTEAAIVDVAIVDSWLKGTAVFNSATSWLC